MTETTKQALRGLRDISTLEWYVIPLLAIVMYIYAKEIRNAREKSNWNVVFCGLCVFGIDFFNETWNGWLMYFSGYSAAWTAPGPTALRTMVGWNIEIMFMFAIAGLIYCYSLSENHDKKILGLNEKWVMAIGFSVFCVAIEVLLNKADLLIWEYAWWNASFGGIWLIIIFGYAIFFFGAGIMLSLKTNKKKITMISIIYAVPIIMNIIAICCGWRY